ncbi:MAG: hypothetical protein KGI37_04915 [Alphaproteobacteria bacterium]|nr:hypothetical protein [Alphaproteobacteria bacterium]
MSDLSENQIKAQDGESCATGACGTGICSPCTMMKVIMIGMLALAGFKYLAG